MKKFFLPFSILVLAGLLRIGWLNVVPPSLSWDEVSLGYNAWSILKTGKDEFGNHLPMLFRAFDEFKLPGYIYLTVLSEAIFGLNEWGVRLPSAFFGTLTVIVFYFLLQELFDNSKTAIRNSLICSFLLAINPWHINFSRGAFETNLSLFFFLVGILFLFKSLKKPLFYLFASVFFVFSLATYYTARVTLPFVLFVFVIVFKKEVLNKKTIKFIILSLFIGILLLIPLIKETFFSEGGFARVSQVSIFVHNKTLVESYAQEIARQNNSLLARVFYNRRFAYFLTFAESYLKSFSPDFLFVNGVWMSGLFYLWEVITIPLGLVSVFSSANRWKWIILTWFFANPISGALSIGAPNAFRNLLNIPPMVIFSGLGVAKILDWISTKKLRLLSLTAFSFIVAFFFLDFCLLYFDYTPFRKALDLGDGYKQLAEVLKEKQKNYDRIWVTGDYWRPYIHLLFHLKYDPALFQKSGNVSGFSLFRFGKAKWDNEGLDLSQVNLSELKEGKTLFALSDNDYQNQLKKGTVFSSKTPLNGLIAKNVFWLLEL